MAAQRISQREARRLRKRVEELEGREDSRLNRWARSWPGGIDICGQKYEACSQVPVAIRTARALQHAVVVTCTDDGTVRFHACQLTTK